MTSEKTIKIRRKKRVSGFDVFLVIFFLLVSLLMLFPFYNALMISLVTQETYSNSPVLLFTSFSNFTFESYKYVITAPLIWNAYGITIFEVLVGTTCNVLVTVSAGYVLSRKNFFLKNAIMNLIIFTMFFSGGFIPWYRMLLALGFKNNLLVLVLPGLLDTYNLLLARNYMASLPYEMEESAKMDGANDIVILFKIYFNLAMPIIATITLFYAVGHWNNWYSSMLFMSSPKLQSLSYVLRRIIVDNTGAIGASPIDKPIFSDGIKMASIFFTMLPIMCFYPFLQRFFVRGIMVGAIKG